jgi:hypothetical protein
MRITIIIVWVIMLATRLTTGSISVGKTTFLTRCGLAVMELVLAITVSLKVFHGIRALRKTTRNGKPPIGVDLNIIEKTNQKTTIVINGFIIVQRKPDKVPA